MVRAAGGGCRHGATVPGGPGQAPLAVAAGLAADTDAARILGPVEQRRLALGGAAVQGDRPGQHEPCHIAKRFERMLPDPVPADVLEFFARRRFAEHIGAVAEEEPGIEPAAPVTPGDRPPPPPPPLPTPPPPPPPSR